MPRPEDVDRWSDSAVALVTAAAAGVALHLRFGYRIGLPDQQVLMVRGIAAADPTAFVNDWFDRAAPQPHWSFDLVTYVGERTGTIPELFFGYWLVSLLAFGLATAWLGRRWLPSHSQWLVPMVGPVLVLAPISIMGSTSPLLAWALPHVLGGCLAYLALAALLTGRVGIACLACVATAIAHVQHGANVAVVLIASALLLRGASRASRWSLAATAGAIVVMSVIVTRVRGIVGNGSDFVEICNSIVPFHCQATVWPNRWFLDGAALCGLVVLLCVARWRSEGRDLIAPLLLPVAGLCLGVYADWADLPVFGELAQRTNIYRLVTVVAPFGAWALVGGVVASIRAPLLKVVAAVTVSALGYVWLTGFTAVFDSAPLTPLAVVVLLGMLSLSIDQPRIGLRLSGPLLGLPVAALLLVLAIASPSLDWRSFRPGLQSAEPTVAIGRVVEASTAPGSVIAAAPSIDWLRFMSRRAVVADCKAVPYGGEPWREYQERMAALGGRICHDASGFAALGLADLVQLAEDFDVTHAFMAPSDPKWLAAREAGWVVVLDGNEEGAGGFVLVEVPGPGQDRSRAGR